jgi:hypothetical protein
MTKKKREPRPGRSQVPVSFEIEPGLLARLEAAREASGRKLREEIVLAIERHLAYPPRPAPPPPLPDGVQP